MEIFWKMNSVDHFEWIQLCISCLDVDPNYVNRVFSAFESNNEIDYD